MQRWETMTNKEIMEVLRCPVCDYCKAKEAHKTVKECYQAKRFWLEMEVELVPRISLINTAADYDKAKEEFEHICRNSDCEFGCRYNSGSSCVGDTCFEKFFKENVVKER